LWEEKGDFHARVESKNCSWNFSIYMYMSGMDKKDDRTKKEGIRDKMPSHTPQTLFINMACDVKSRFHQ
ncbi:hypothetical protein P4533_01890, partial [Geobacillus stearothermophilus]|uniref:hypothetical protein n=1 Tax=Geobacillus stearothermophilus TaxID=1422 RepID=UPI002E1EBE58|nr:hypothetical protein [Geobacillus stearothermophilus]